MAMTTVPTDAELQAQADERGAVFINESKLKENIKQTQFIVVPGSQLTICVLTLLNGFTVTGESACADPKMFKRETGEAFAFAAAERKVWPLLGYALKQELFLSGSSDSPKGRVELELTELNSKIGKLGSFIKGHEHFKSLSNSQRDLLCEQFETMQKYASILEERLKSWA
jgi:hypothetical protein